jgi:hypothetical protein
VGGGVEVFVYFSKFFSGFPVGDAEAFLKLFGAV